MKKTASEPYFYRTTTKDLGHKINLDSLISFINLYEKVVYRNIKLNMGDSYVKEVRPLLDLVDRLRDIGVNKEVSLPQIVVMGDQSSGKSSVLQSISGIPFPRGSGLVTRCPLELRMKKASNADESWSAEVSIRWDLPQPPEAGAAHDIHDLMEKIKIMSELIAQRGKNGFSHHSVSIKITARDSPDLTLIDLPGIVRTTTAGQDNAVIYQVNEMINQYISLPNTIILAVIPSNQDIATVDILERAIQVDPTGSRTIGVLTKPDLIGPGSEDEVVQVLLNIRKPLKLGYIMVKNVSQKQLNESISVEEARQDEITFFQKHPVFSKYHDQHLFGVENLTNVLTKLLATHIRRTLPAVMQEVRVLLTQSKEELTQLGPAPPSDGREIQSVLVKKIYHYCQVLRHSSRGEYRDKSGILAKSADYRLHAKTSKFFKQMQDHILDLRPDFTENTKPAWKLLEDEMQSQKGRELPGFLNTHVFASCIVTLVEEWRQHVDECSSDIIASAIKVATSLSQILFAEFPLLQEKIDQLTVQMIDQTADKLRDSLENLIAREQDPFTTQEVLLEVVNSIRFRTFDTILRQIMDSTDVKAMGDNKYLMEEDVKKRLGKS